MKAIQFSKFGGRDVLEYIETPKPVPQDNELLIEVTASGVNFVDIRERIGVYARAETHVGQDKLLPRISGLQVVGHVVDTGPSGDHGLIGEKVMALPARRRLCAIRRGTRRPDHPPAGGCRARAQARKKRFNLVWWVDRINANSGAFGTQFARDASSNAARPASD